MLERVICAGVGLYASVLALVAGQQAVNDVTVVAHRWASAILAHAAWVN